MTNHAPTHSQQMLSRRALAARWGVSTETVKRRERDGFLRAHRFNSRLVRYRIEEVEAYERSTAV